MTNFLGGILFLVVCVIAWRYPMSFDTLLLLGVVVAGIYTAIKHATRKDRNHGRKGHSR